MRDYSCVNLFFFSLFIVKFEVELKKSQSVKEMTNKLTYMKNSLTYLNQKAFEPYIQISKNSVDNNSGIGSETIII